MAQVRVDLRQAQLRHRAREVAAHELRRDADLRRDLRDLLSVLERLPLDVALEHRRQHHAERGDQHQREQAELAEQGQAWTAETHHSLIDQQALELKFRRTLVDVPEGDTIHHAAGRIRPVLEGHVPDALETPHPRFARDRWPERLAGQAVRSVDTHGKHLFLRFEGGLTIHSHLRMTGAWRVVEAGRRWPRPARAAWLVLRRGERTVVQFDGPLLELMTESRTRFDQRIAGLGPDILAPEFDYERYLRRLREDDPTRPIGDAVIEQRIVAGIGNMWKAEACFEAGIDPWRPTGTVSDAEAVAIVDAARPRMQASARDGDQRRHRRVYGRAGLPCPRCGAASRIRAKGQGDDNRRTFWCPRCQS
jgi:endonuclease-8